MDPKDIENPIAEADWKWQSRMERIMREHPSVCHTCRHARKPASEENVEKGYVGCAEYTRKNHFDFIQEAKEVAEGWVDLRARVFGEKSGIITNLQLVTLKVAKCSSYDKAE